MNVSSEEVNNVITEIFKNENKYYSKEYLEAVRELTINKFKISKLDLLENRLMLITYLVAVFFSTLFQTILLVVIFSIVFLITLNKRTQLLKTFLVLKITLASMNEIINSKVKAG